MNVLHLMVSGRTGGIEILVRNYVKISKHDHSFLFVWSGGEIAEELHEYGFDVIIIGKGKTSYRSVMKEINNIHQEKRFDAVVTHYAAPVLRYVSISLKKRNPKLKVISYVHSDAGVMYSQYGIIKRLLSYAIQKYAFKKSDVIIAISNWVKNSVENKYNIDDSKILVIYNGIPLEQFMHKHTVKENGRVNIVYIGRLIEGKGVQHILKALSHTDNSLFRFNIIGEGDYKKKLMLLSKELKMDECVSFLGNRSDISDLLKHSDIFIHFPVLEEGFGITVIEAMAGSHVCICSKSGGIPEIIKHGENGFLVEKGNEEELSSVINSIILKYPSSVLNKVEKEACLGSHNYSIEAYSKRFDEVIETTVRAE